MTELITKPSWGYNPGDRSALNGSSFSLDLAVQKINAPGENLMMNDWACTEKMLVTIVGMFMSALVGAGLCISWLLFHIGVPFTPAYEKTFLLVTAGISGTGLRGKSQ